MGGLIAMDISAAATGWAWGEDGAPARLGTFSAVRPGDRAKDHGGRFHRYSEWLSDLFRVLTPRALFFEAPIPAIRQSNSDTARQLFGFIAITESLAYQHNMAPVCEVHIQTIRAYFAGKGNADKAQIIAECHRRGWLVQTDGEADACAVWWYGRNSPSTAGLFGKKSAQDQVVT